MQRCPATATAMTLSEMFSGCLLTLLVCGKSALNPTCRLLAAVIELLFPGLCLPSHEECCGGAGSDG